MCFVIQVCSVHRNKSATRLWAAIHPPMNPCQDSTGGAWHCHQLALHTQTNTSPPRRLLAALLPTLNVRSRQVQTSPKHLSRQDHCRTPQGEEIIFQKETPTPLQALGLNLLSLPLHFSVCLHQKMRAGLSHALCAPPQTSGADAEGSSELGGRRGEGRSTRATVTGAPPEDEP